MTTLAEVNKQIAELQKVQEKLVREERVKVIAKIKEQIAEFKIKPAEIRNPKKKRAAAE